MRGGSSHRRRARRSRRQQQPHRPERGRPAGRCARGPPSAAVRPPIPSTHQRGTPQEVPRPPHLAVRAHAVTVAGAAAAVDASTRNQQSHRPHRHKRRTATNCAADAQACRALPSHRPHPTPSHPARDSPRHPHTSPPPPQYPTAYTSPTPYRARISSIVPAAGGGPASAAAAAACPCANVDATRPGVPARKRHHSPPA